jgi:hypothetical protein
VIWFDVVNSHEQQCACDANDNDVHDSRHLPLGPQSSDILANFLALWARSLAFGYSRIMPRLPSADRNVLLHWPPAGGIGDAIQFINARD